MIGHNTNLFARSKNRFFNQLFDSNLEVHYFPIKLMNEQSTFLHDMQVVEYIQKKSFHNLDVMRRNHLVAREKSKNLMIDFLMSIFLDPLHSILHTNLGDFFVSRSSIYEGMSSTPNLSDFE